MTNEPKLQPLIAEITTNTTDYRQWLGELKTRFRQVQLSTDLRREFPDVQGFSVSNLKSIRQWHLFYAGSLPIGQQPVGQLAQQPVSQILSIPWGHNLAILAKCKQHDEALYYAQATQTYGWSRSVLVHQIESGLWQREGKAITNFEQTLPAAQSDLASEDDQPTIGLLLCKSKDRLVAEYALSDIQKPMGLSTYTLSHTLPEALRDKLPSIEAIERELGLDGGNEA